MVLIALFFGLRLKGWPVANQVRWLPDSRAIRFEDAGIAYVDDLRAVRQRVQPGPFTIEMAVTPANDQKGGFSPLLVMHDGDDRRQLAVWQYNASLIVMNGDDYDNRQRRPRVTGRDVFSGRQTRYLTITSGEQGTRLYVDGVPVAAKREWALSIPRPGSPLRLVLGNSVHGKHVWQGDLHGLAVSGEALSADAVGLNFDRWATARNFDFLKQRPAMLLFTFDRDTGARVTDRSGNGNDLIIPERLVVLQKTILAPVQRQLHLNRAAVGDMVVNVVGFIPVGIVFYGFLQCFSGPLSKRSLLFAVVLCMLLSLGIELVQAWIPTRHSSLQDWILNSFGAWIGVVGWRLVRAKGRS
jgi:hypothetical protein